MKETIEFKELWVGDRFVFQNNLYTKIDLTTARSHSQYAMELKDKGYGYIGDVIVSIHEHHRVRFIAPSHI